MCCFFEVPEFVIGYPLYNINECVNYIHDKLTSNGFLVKYYFPNILYISWSEDEIKYEKLMKQAQLLQHTQQQQITHDPFPLQQTATKPGKKKGQRAKKQLQTPSITSSLLTPKKKEPETPDIIPVNPKNKQKFIKSISDFKPSGKFVLDVT